MTQTEEVTKALEKRGNGKALSITELIEKSTKSLGHALPKHMNPERITRIALTTLRLNPTLYKCDPKSFLAALFQSAQLGLEPNVNGEAWIIPYDVYVKELNRKVKMAQFQVGAYGYVKMFWNHQNSVSLQMEVVRENDLFEYNLADGSIKHQPPSFNIDRGKVVGYYAVAMLKGGGRSAKVMSHNEAMEHAKKFSKCWDNKIEDFRKYTPWKEHFDAMALKTVLIQLMKLLPKSVEIQQAISMDGTVKSAVEIDMSAVPDEITPEDHIDAEYTESKPAEEVKEEAKTEVSEEEGGEPEFK